MGDFELVNELSILLAARRPQWALQVAAATAIPAPAEGVYLENAPKAALVVHVREVLVGRSGRVTLPVFDAASTYTVTVDGNVNTANEATLAAAITTLAANITADTPAGAGDVVTATAVESVVGGGIDTLLLRGKAPADWIATLSVAAGAGTILGTLDGNGCTVDPYFTGKSPNAPGSTSAGGAGEFSRANVTAYTLTSSGFVERFDTAGLDRAYAQIDNLTNPADVAGASASFVYRAPRVWWGPAVKE